MNAKISFDAPNYVVDRLCNVIHVLSGQSDHSDSAVFHHMDVVVVDQGVYLRLAQTCVWEHADLISYVWPTARSLQFLQSVSK